jgi:hypothetical protein
VPRADVETHTACHKNVTYVVTDLSEEDYQEYYNGFANRVLWPILHFRLDLCKFELGPSFPITFLKRLYPRGPLGRCASLMSSVLRAVMRTLQSS